MDMAGSIPGHYLGQFCQLRSLHPAPHDSQSNREEAGLFLFHDAASLEGRGIVLQHSHL
jgi:hypothetical protein